MIKEVNPKKIDEGKRRKMERDERKKVTLEGKLSVSDRSGE